MASHPERWRPVPDPVFGVNYEVSDQGSVRRTSTSRTLKPSTDAKGYQRVDLSVQGTSRTFKVHRLVALAFVPGHAPGLEARHVHGTAGGDAASNLVWGTAKQNAADRDRAGKNFNKRKTHCSQGHEFSPTNTRYDADGHRICRTCSRIICHDYDRNRRGKNHD